MSAAVMSTHAYGGNVYGTHKRRFGEVLITHHREIILRCTFCEEEYRVYKSFLEHILAHYNSEMKLLQIANEAQCTVRQVIKRESPEELVEDKDVPVKVEMLKEADEERDPLSEEEFLEAPSSQGLRTPSPVIALPKNRGRRRNFNQNQRKFECETCGHYFKDASNLRVHMLRHTGHKPHPCEQCDARFYTTTELTSHIRHRHTGERPYVCSFCGQNFTTSSHLKNHERRHSDYRAFKCDHCEKRFYDSTRLKDHISVHTGERNHICSTCNATFSRRKSLQQHMRLHVNAREYACDMCDMAFNQMPALWLHKKNKHKVVKPTARKTKQNTTENMESELISTV